MTTATAPSTTSTTSTKQARKPRAKKAPAQSPPTSGHTLPKPATDDAIPMAELVAHIRAQAKQDRNYGGFPSGWDVIEDTWTDEMIEAQISGAKTKLGAQQRMGRVVNALRAEKRAARDQAKAETEAAKLAEAEVEKRSGE